MNRMQAALHILRLIRWPNLLVILLTQFLLGRLLYSRIEAGALEPADFVLLVLVTVLIAAGGYVVNDIYDVDIDQVNKPETMILRRHISLRQAWKIYWVITWTGFVLAIYLAFKTGQYIQLVIYPAAVFVLWAYAKKLKGSPLAGNVVIALYCAFVPGILLYAERDAFRQIAHSPKGRFVLNVFVVYAVMAFLTTVWRELIKDIEDIQGDRLQGARTLPVRIGITGSRRVSVFTGLVIGGAIAYYLIRLAAHKHWLDTIYVAGLLALTGKIIAESLKKTFVLRLHYISSLIKWLMVGGLLYLFLLL